MAHNIWNWQLKEWPNFTYDENALKVLEFKFSQNAGTVLGYSKQNKIAYIHFRNVKGKVPCYKEVFVDEGDIDMLKILAILKKNNYTGVIIPDHTPQMSCNAPWHEGSLTLWDI